MALNPTMFSVLVEAVLIIAIGYASNEKLSFQSAMINGILVVVAAANLLYLTYSLGYLLLVYGIILMVYGMKEKEMEELKGKGDFMGYVVKVMGNYAVAAIVVITVTLISFEIWPFTLIL